MERLENVFYQYLVQGCIGNIVKADAEPAKHLQKSEISHNRSLPPLSLGNYALYLKLFPEHSNINAVYYVGGNRCSLEYSY